MTREQLDAYADRIEAMTKKLSANSSMFNHLRLCVRVARATGEQGSFYEGVNW